MPVLDAYQLDTAPDDALRVLGDILHPEGLERPKPRGWFTAPREIGRVQGGGGHRGGRRPVRRAAGVA